MLQSFSHFVFSIQKRLQGHLLQKSANGFFQFIPNRTEAAFMKVGTNDPLDVRGFTVHAKNLSFYSLDDVLDTDLRWRADQNIATLLALHAPDNPPFCQPFEDFSSVGKRISFSLGNLLGGDRFLLSRATQTPQQNK